MDECKGETQRALERESVQYKVDGTDKKELELSLPVIQSLTSWPTRKAIHLLPPSPQFSYTVERAISPNSVFNKVILHFNPSQDEDAPHKTCECNFINVAVNIKFRNGRIEETRECLGLRKTWSRAVGKLTDSCVRLTQ
ncbi:hypothetical protein J6590_029060 [Homalodisca vitripennis]|nr:hypothetical protein J6590_029060 [Homalodisca vitripennis]